MAGVPKNKQVVALAPNSVISLPTANIADVKLTPAAGRGKGHNLTIVAAGGQQLVIKGKDENDDAALTAAAEALKPFVQERPKVREVQEINL